MKIIKLLTLSIVTLFFVACVNDDLPNNNVESVPIEEATISEVALNSPNLSGLALALDLTGLLERFNDQDKNFTFITPNDNAFVNFLNSSPYLTLDEIPNEILEEILLNHVIEGNEITSNNLLSESNGYLKMDSGFDVFFSANESMVEFNGHSRIVDDGQDIEVVNGTMHFVNELIVPATLTTFIENDPNLATLHTAMTFDNNFNFIETLSSTENESDLHTVFAPTQSAFNDLFSELGSPLNEIETELLEAILNLHIVDNNEIFAENISDEMVITTLGGDITANITGGATLTDGNDRVSNIQTTDITAKNGVLHKIDKVLLPLD